jgi:hypothetical protein
LRDPEETLKILDGSEEGILENGQSIADSITIEDLTAVIDLQRFSPIGVINEFGRQLSRLLSVSSDYAYLLSRSIELYVFRVGMSSAFEPVREVVKKKSNEGLRLMRMVQERHDRIGIVSGQSPPVRAFICSLMNELNLVRQR